MADRTVTVRLRLDSSQWTAGQSSAVAGTQRLATTAQSAATAAERSAQRTAAAVSGTFRGMAAQGTAALDGLGVAASRSSQALAAQVTAATRTTATAATAASRTTEQASATAAASTRQIAAAAGEIPAAFRSATAAASASLARLDVTNQAAQAATTRTALAQRQALTAGAAAITQAASGIGTVTTSGIAGMSSLGVAARLNLAQATAASQTATTAATAAVARVTTAAHLTSMGASSAAAGAADAVARANANAAALSSTFGATAARARTMGSSVVTAAGNSEKALKSARTASLGLVAVFAAAVYANARFETAISGVKAATQGTTKELTSLRQAAIDAGSGTQYSATQAADAETELAKAGVSTSDILGGALKGTLSLAAAGQMDVADSAVVAAKAMNSFGLSGKDMSHISDVIAAAAGKSATDVHGMSLAMAQSALLAHQTGLSLEQTAGALALFAQNGLEGSDAGTSLKTMLMRLTPQSAEARAEMDKIGFSAYDASGNFVGWSKTAQNLQNSLRGLSPQARNYALSVIFGSDAIRAATIVAQAGAKGVDQWTKAANDSGYAARYAATQTDNLEGDARRLASALETALISSGTAANGMLRDMAQALTSVVRWYSNLPPQVQQSVTVLGGMVGVVGLISTGLLLLLPRIVTVGRELKNLGVTAAGTRTALMGIGRLTLVVGVLTALTMASDKLTAAIRGPGPDVAKLTDQLVDLAQSGKATAGSVKELDGFGDAVARIAHPSTLNRLDDIASSVGHLGLTGSKVGSYTDAKNKINALDESLAQLVQSGSTDLAAKAFTKMATEAEKSGTSTSKLRGMLPKYADALATADAQQKLATTGSKALGDQASTTADDLQDTRTEVEKLTDALDSLNGNAISSAQASISFQQSLADLKTAVKESGHSLDDTTAKGRAVKGAFLDAADAAMKHAEAVATQTNSQAAGNKVLAQDVDALKAQMLALGFSKTAVDKLLKSYAQVPASAVTKVSAPGAETTAAELDAIRKKVAAVPAGKSITVTAPSAAAIADLKAIGYKVTSLPNHTIKISVPTSGQTTAVARLKAQIQALRDRTVVLTIEQRVKSGAMTSQGAKNAIETRANGGLIGHAANGLYVPGYQPRVDSVPAVLSPGEGVLVPEAVLRLGALTGLGPAGVIKALNSWGRYGTTAFADGGLVGSFTYSGGLVSVGTDDPRTRFDNLVDKLRDAWSTYRSAVKDLAAVKKDKTSTSSQRKAAQSAVSSDLAKVKSLDSQLGLPSGAAPPTTLNLTAYQKQLTDSVAATNKWRTNLAKIGKRGGTEVQQLLADMGTAGYSLVNELAGASTKQFNAIVANLKKLDDTAKASIADYTQQLNTANTANKTFQQNLLKLAAMGDTALASQLAAQGDDAAAAVAAAAVKSSSAASSANKAAQANAALLSSDDLANAVTLLGVLRAHPGAGIADVLAAGLDWATVQALAPKIATQIKAVSGSGEFVSEMRAQGVAMARGGILNRPTVVLGAEAGHTESWIPWDGSARSAALLTATARGMGYQLVPASRYSGGGQAAGAVPQQVTRHNEVHLHGAKQSSAEQLHDVVRHLTFIG